MFHKILVTLSFASSLISIWPSAYGQTAIDDLRLQNLKIELTEKLHLLIQQERLAQKRTKLRHDEDCFKSGESLARLGIDRSIISHREADGEIYFNSKQSTPTKVKNAHCSFKEQSEVIAKVRLPEGRSDKDFGAELWALIKLSPDHYNEIISHNNKVFGLWIAAAFVDSRQVIGATTEGKPCANCGTRINVTPTPTPKPERDIVVSIVIRLGG